MFCDFCLKAGVSSDKSFIKGCTSLKLESIKHHEASNMHLLSANKHVNEEKPEEAPALKAKLILIKLAMDRLTILFCTVHAINLQGQPVSDYCWMSEVGEVKGLNIGKVYRSSHMYNEFSQLLLKYNVMKSKSIWLNPSLFQ